MIDAILKGKISRQVEGKEDMLTSITFGIMKLLPAHLGIAKLLQNVQGLPWEVGTSKKFPPLEIDSMHIDFWPWWHGEGVDYGAEPDVAILLTLNDGNKKLIAVEVKRSSSIHGENERNQLRRQIVNGMVIARDQKAEFIGLIYVTEHFTIPVNDIEISQMALARSEINSDLIYWMSWRDFIPLLRTINKEAHSYKKVVEDVINCLQRWRLFRYQGFTTPKTFSDEPRLWHFIRG